MKVFNLFLLLVLLNIVHESNEFGILSAVIKVVQSAVNLGETIFDAIRYKKIQEDLLNSLASAWEASLRINGYIDSINDQMDQFIAKFDNKLCYELAITEFTNIVVDIDNLHKQMNEYIMHDDEATMEDFLHEIVSYSSNSVRVLIELLARYLYGMQYLFGSFNVVGLLSGIVDEESYPTLVETFYNIYVTAELQTTLLLSWAYSYFDRQTYSMKLEYDQEQRLIIFCQNKRIQMVSHHLNKIMNLNTTWMPFYNRNASLAFTDHIELVGLERTILYQLSDFDNNQQCTHECNNYKSPTKPSRCDYKPLCRIGVPPCDGKLSMCKNATTPLMICYDSSDKQRHFIKYLKLSDQTGAYGIDPGNSKGGCRNITNAESNCGICLCTCVEETIRAGTNREIRRFNMKDVLTDAENNKVLTGARFVEKEGLIYTQIRQSVLTGINSVDQDSHEWIPIDTYNYGKGTKDEDYFEFTATDRTIGLDLLNSTFNRAITGISFHKWDNVLVVAIREHTYSTTEKKLRDSRWFYSNHETSTFRRNAVRVADSIVHPHEEITQSDRAFESFNFQSVTFKTSSLASDVAQTVVPVFDTTEVVASPAVPIHTFGLYYNSFGNKAGCIGIILGTFDLLNYIDQLPVA